MTRRIYIIFFCLAAGSCQQPPDEEAAPVAPPVTDTLIYAKDLQQYSPDFVAGLKASGFAHSYRLTDSLLILNDGDTAYFPADLPWKTEIRLLGSRNDSSWTLVIRRDNYVACSFHFRLMRRQYMLFDMSGQAELAPLFFLAAETAIDDSTQQPFLTVTYSASRNNCSVQIGVGRNDNDQLLGQISVQCNGREGPINLERGPTLRPY